MTTSTVTGVLPLPAGLAPLAAQEADPDARERGATARFYRPELDGLRFFAFLAVYIEHTVGFGIGHHNRLPEWIGDLMGAVGYAGTFGVDLFFVLSSYLITELLLRERAVRGELDVKSFYIRRMLRIWPLYFFVLFLSYAVTFFVPSEGLTWKHVLAFLFFTGNWAYFLYPINTIAAPMWSISLEEQFYLIWPWVIRRSSVRQIATCAFGLMVIALVARFAMGTLHPDEDWVSKNSFTRIDGIAVGALLAIRMHGRVPSFSTWTRAALMGGGLLTLLWVAYSFGLFQLPVAIMPLMLGWPLAALACGAILLSVLGSQGPYTALLRSGPIVYLGRLSFGLYVYHEMVLRIADNLFPQHTSSAGQMLAYWFSGLFITLPIAAASYRWLEMPFLRLKRSRYTVVQSRPD